MNKRKEREKWMDDNKEREKVDETEGIRNEGMDKREMNGEREIRDRWMNREGHEREMDEQYTETNKWMRTTVRKIYM